MYEDAYGSEELERVAGSIKAQRRCERVIGGGVVQSRDRYGLFTDVIGADLDNLQNWRAYVFGSQYTEESTGRLLLRKGIAVAARPVLTLTLIELLIACGTGLPH